MYLSEKKEYRTALVTKNAVLSVELLKTQLTAFGYHLEKKQIKAGDSVIVWLPEEAQLLSALWALAGAEVVCILFDPKAEKSDINDFVNHAEVKCVITTSEYAAGITAAEVIITEEVFASAVPVNYSANSDKKLNGNIFYIQEDENQGMYALSGKTAEAFYKQLDHQLNLVVGDHMMLSACLSFPRLVMEMLWASSRGLTIISDQLKDEFSMERYTSDSALIDMNFGLFYFGSYVEEAEKERYRLLFDTVKFADEHGFTAVWTPERHFNEFGGLYPNPSVIGAALAVMTSHVQIRSGSLVSPLHHAVRIAEDWSVIDNLSKGRVAISFASGWQCDDFIFCPENYPVRHEHMMTQIRTVRNLWKGEKALFKNGLENDIQVAIYPKPVQKELPVWITVAGKVETFIDAGKIGANILTHLLWQDTDELIEKIAAYRKSLKDNGFDPRSGIVSVMAHTHLGQDNEVVKNKVREPLKSYIRSSTQLIQSMVKSNAQAADAKDKAGRYGTVNDEIPEHLLDELAEIAFNRFFDQAGLLGTVEKAEKMIRKLKGYDVDEIACLTDFGLGREDILESLGYLNELRGFYDKTTRNCYPADVIHCTLDSLISVSEKSEFANFLATRKHILVEASDFNQIPEFLRSKVRLVYEDGQEISLEAYNFSNEHVKSSFSALINEDF